MRPLMYHQIITFSESALAVLAYKLAFRTHLPAELSAAHVVLNLHYRKHRARLLSGTVVVNHLVFGNLDDDDDDEVFFRLQQQQHTMLEKKRDDLL